ncbi:hypothetical protein TNCV_3133181 [Trichonephila clavipes]|nr:hypothetical protein TNCV_3133181 [Trichonephila clavipes]
MAKLKMFLVEAKCSTAIAVIQASNLIPKDHHKFQKGILGNERANQKTKQEAESSQPEVALILRRVKVISIYID